MKTIEQRVRDFVIHVTELAEDRVFIAPLRTEKPDELHAVVNVPAIAPESVNGPKAKRHDDDGTEYTTIQWEGAVHVTLRGEGHGPTARRMFAVLMSDSLMNVDRKYGFLFDMRGFNIADLDLVSEGRTLPTGADFEPTSTFRAKAVWDETIALPIEYVEAVRVGIDHEPPSPPIHEDV